MVPSKVNQKKDEPNRKERKVVIKEMEAGENLGLDVDGTFSSLGHKQIFIW